MYVCNKFDVGDEVYFTNSDNKPCKSKVRSIYVHVDAEETVIDYGVKIKDGDIESFGESDLLSSECDLKDKWMKDLIEFV